MLCKKCREIIPDDSLFCQYCGNSQTVHKGKKSKKKRSNGEGSVVFLGKNRTLPYAVRISATIDGKKKRPYIGYFATEKEANAALAEQQTNPIAAQARITFKALFEQWKSTRAYIDISQATKYNYDAAYRHYSDIHSKAFTDLRTNDFERCIYSAQKTVKGVSTPLSASGKRHMKILAGLLTKYALENDLIRKGYAEYIRLEKTEKTEREIFSEVEIETLFKNDIVPGVDIILILIYTGMRINELLNLTKFNIDMTANTITGGLKTDAGRDRIIPINNKIRKYIEKYYNLSLIHI